MTTEAIRTEDDRERVIRLIQSRELPFTTSIRKGVKRSDISNNLQQMWVLEASQQGDDTAEGYRSYCKLHFGVPLLRYHDEDFREKYDRVIKPLTYEQKLELMGDPFDFPVTRLMLTPIYTQYMKDIYNHLTGLGFRLTDPEQRGMDYSEAKQ